MVYEGDVAALLPHKANGEAFFFDSHQGHCPEGKSDSGGHDHCDPQNAMRLFVGSLRNSCVHNGKRRG